MRGSKNFLDDLDNATDNLFFAVKDIKVSALSSACNDVQKKKLDLAIANFSLNFLKARKQFIRDVLEIAKEVYYESLKKEKK